MKEKQTLAIEFADEELEALVVYHKSNSKSYKKLKSNASLNSNLSNILDTVQLTSTKQF